MSPEHLRQPEDAEAYRMQLEHILSTPLTPENIDSYADSALDQLVALVETVVSDYGQEHAASFLSQRDMEETAFRHYGLQNIEMVLDHVADIGESVDRTKTVMQSALVRNDIIIPSAGEESPVLPPEGEKHGEQLPTSRVRSVLFVLEHDFDIDITNPQIAEITAGLIPRHMWRKASYYAIHVPSLERLILACDARNNATYVIDTVRLQQSNRTETDVISSTKEELTALFIAHPEIGQRMRYHPKAFIPRLIKAITFPRAPKNEPQESLEEKSYLYPNADDMPDIHTINRVAQDLGLDHVTIERLLDVLIEEGEIPPPSTYLFRSRRLPGLTPEHRKAIHDRAEAQRMLFPDAPDGFTSIPAFAHTVHSTAPTIIRLYNQLIAENAIPEGATFRFSSQPTIGLDRHTQKQMAQQLLAARNQVTREGAQQLLDKLIQEEREEAEQPPTT